MGGLNPVFVGAAPRPRIPRPNATAVVHHGRDGWRADLPPRLAGGQRLRRHFKTRDQAEVFARRPLAEARQTGPDPADEMQHLGAAALAEGENRIGAEHAKTRRALIVPVPLRARARLDVAFASGGSLCPDQARLRWRRVPLAAGFRQRDRPHNVLRHSFCTCHLAAYQPPAQTACQAGHSERILARHYRGLAPQSVDLTFFGLLPDPALVAAGRDLARFSDAMARQRLDFGYDWQNRRLS